MLGQVVRTCVRAYMLAMPLQLIHTSKNLHCITHHLDIRDQVMCLYTYCRSGNIHKFKNLAKIIRPIIIALPIIGNDHYGTTVSFNYSLSEDSTTLYILSPNR